jgi:hypothetical protein
MPMRGHGFSQAELQTIETDPHFGGIEVTSSGQRILSA